jgi:TP901 family phage tail tape measure protein
MTMERVGVQAVVDGAGGYVSDASRVNAATLGMATAAKSAEGSFGVFARAQDEAQARLRNTGSQMRQTGTEAIFLGAALAAPGAIAVKFAADFESAFAGVRKTVDATEAQFGELRSGILNLTSELPTSASGLADIAAAAGQLGVARADILDFTRVTAQLAETTDLSTETAATGLARFANILQLPQDAVERTASALVDLGNKSAATESEILDISTRLAAAGKTIGLSAQDVLAFGTALRSVGVESEAGGTAFSRTFIEIAKAVEGGGSSLNRFAEVAGQTGEQFRQSFERDAAGAVVTFIEGLGRMQETGRGTFGVLEELSLNDARLTRALLSAASAGDLFRESLATGQSAFRANSALSAEFGKRMETTAAQARLLFNEIQRLGIEVGTSLLPAIKAAIAVVRGFVDVLNAIPGPIKTAAAVVSLLVGGLVIAAGTFAFVAGSVLNIVGTLAILGLTGASVAGGIAALTGALGTAAAALGGLAISSVGFIIPLAALALAVGAVVVAFKVLDTEATATVKAAQAEAKTLRDQIAEVRKETERLIEVEKERRRLAGAGITSPDLDTAQRERGRQLLAQLREQVPQGDTGAAAREATNAFVFSLSREDEALLTTARLEEDLTAARREGVRARLASAGGAQEAYTAEIELLSQARGGTVAHTAALLDEVTARRAVTEASARLTAAQDALNAARLSGDADAIAAAERNVAAALRETNDATANLPLAIGAITNAQQAMAFSASEAGIKQRELNKALFETAIAAAASARRPSGFGDFAEEGTGRGGTEGFEGGRPVGAEALRLLQQQSGAIKAANDEALRAATKAGAGGASILERRKSALEGTEKRQREEQASALIRERVGLKPGEKGLSAVQAEQARLDAAFSGIVDELAALGFEVPEEFRDMFDRIQTETEEGSKRAGGKIGGLLGFLVARRFNAGLDPTAGLISQPAAVTASLTKGTPREAGVNIENVNIGAGTTTGDIQQGMGVAFRASFGSV